MDEAEQIRMRYERRQNLPKDLYSFNKPNVYMAEQEKEREIINLLRCAHLFPLENKRVLEVGCGTGASLMLLIRIGFNPEHMAGNDLLNERLARARQLLPASVKLMSGNAAESGFSPGTFDVIMQSTVFSSILNHDVQAALARNMWSSLAPGGGILWYDFIYNNPANPDVQGVPIKRIRSLFPQGKFYIKRLTLAPPISRRVCRIHPRLYTVFNFFPFLRTHVLCWIAKC